MSQHQYNSHIQSISLPFLRPRQLQCLYPLLADYSVCHVHSSSNHGFACVHLPFHSAFQALVTLLCLTLTLALWMTSTCFGW
jgi:hypothetical protein